MQVHLPEDLYRAIQEEGLHASELLEEAIRVELRRIALREATDQLVEDSPAAVEEPDMKEEARAQELARRLTRRVRRTTW